MARIFNQCSTASPPWHALDYTGEISGLTQRRRRTFPRIERLDRGKPPADVLIAVEWNGSGYRVGQRDRDIRECNPIAHQPAPTTQVRIEYRGKAVKVRRSLGKRRQRTCRVRELHGIRRQPQTGVHVAMAACPSRRVHRYRAVQGAGSTD